MRYGAYADSATAMFAAIAQRKLRMRGTTYTVTERLVAFLLVAAARTAMPVACASSRRFRRPYA